MKKRQKKILGFFGLSAIVVLTAVAVAIPDPNVSAANTGVVDYINVRVVSGSPDVNVSGITKNGYYVNPDRSFEVDFANIDTLVVELTYTDLDGNVITRELDSRTITDSSGVENYTVDISDADYGYGTYVLHVKGTGANGVFDEETVAFYYIPLKAEVMEDETNDDYYVELDYIPDDGTEETAGNVKTIEVEVFNEEGELVKRLEVPAPADRIDLDMNDEDLPAGVYVLRATAYDADGEVIFEPFETSFNYKPVDIDVADTGVFFGQLEIAKNDYLITSLIIFMLVAVAGIIIISKTGKTKAKQNAVRSNRVSKATRASKASKASKVTRTKKVSAKNTRAKKTTKAIKPRKR